MLLEHVLQLAGRAALGARPADVVRLIVGEGMTPALVGGAIGTIGALLATRLLAGLLFGVSPTDPITFAGAVAALGLVALAACYLPARRAAALDPMETLQGE